MRRSQFDAPSQPVRNQCLNPRWETTGVSGIIRTNLCTNPGLEAVGGATLTIRTNLATRPRMVDTSLGGYGTQTLTAVTGLSGHPDNITTAVRVSYTAGASNPGAMISGVPAGSTAHTLSAWVYNEGTSSESIALALQSVGSGGSTVVAPGVWTRLTWVNYVTPASPATSFGARISSPSATGSFLVTGILMEASPFDTGYFFDGNSVTRPDGGSLTYSWTGATGTSTSLQSGISCPSFTGANQTIVYRAGTPGTALAARAHFTSNTITDSGLSMGISFSTAQPSKTYTLSCDITTERDRSVKLSIQGTGTVNTNLTFAHTAGVKVRRSITFQTNSTASGSSNVALYALRTDLLAGYIDVDNILIEEAGFAGTYFDGSTAATADFTHAWAGTANASISRQSAVAMSSTHINTTGTGTKITYMCSDRPAVNGKFIRMVIDTTNSVGLNTLDSIVPAGVKRTNLFWLRTSRAMTIQLRYRSTDGSAVSNGPIIMTAANEWQLWRTADKPSVGNNQHLSLLIANPNTAIGDVVDLGPHMVVEGDYAGEYVDGGKPLSKWTGTADVSESIGYSPQLYDIAGKPDVDVTAPGTYMLDDSYAQSDPRTLYTVFTTLATNIPQTPMLTYGVTGLADTPSFQTMMLRLQMSGSTLGTINRRTSGAGPVSYTVPMPATTVTAWGMNADGIQFVQNNGGTILASSQVMDVPHEQVSVFAATAFHRHVRTLIYKGYHDTATRLNVSRYLANKYGAYVA